MATLAIALAITRVIASCPALTFIRFIRSAIYRADHERAALGSVGEIECRRHNIVWQN